MKHCASPLSCLLHIICDYHNTLQGRRDRPFHDGVTRGKMTCPRAQNAGAGAGRASWATGLSDAFPPLPTWTPGYSTHAPEMKKIQPLQ